MEFEEGEILLCTVDRIIGTVVFVKIDGTKKEGSITLSEVAPGRIRNLRNYVVPKKKIVCKILKIDSSGNIHLSLRRVTPKEQKEIREQYKQERSYQSVLKTIVGEKAKEILEKISKEKRVYDFFQEGKENPKNFEKYLTKKEIDKLLEILNSQKVKKAIVKKQILLHSTNADGLDQLKEILGKFKEVEIKYISAGKYSLKYEDKNMKTADNKLKEIISEIEKFARKNNFEFKVK